MEIYQNQRGERFAVLKSNGMARFKPHKCIDNGGNWERMKAFPWRDTEEEAIADLRKWAENKHLARIDSTGEGTPKIINDVPVVRKATGVAIPRVYIDKRGWRFKVMPGLGENQYKARYKRPDKNGWKCCAQLQWRDTVAEAQSDLDAWAKAKGMKEEGELLKV